MSGTSSNVLKFAPRSAYRPCDTGIHVCGIDDARGEFFTQANFLLPPSATAAAFAKARDMLAESEDGDFVVDMMIDGDLLEDFYIRRQMIDRLKEIAATTRGTNEHT